MTEQIEEKNKLDKDYYQIGKVSGKVSTGYIYEAFQILDPLKKLAMKQVWLENCGRKSLQSILNQLQHLCQFNHKNLLRTYGYYIEGQKACIIMDFYESDLLCLMKQKASKQKSFTLEEIAKCIYQISDAYQYMVENFQIAHRDIRPDNIFIDNDNNFVLANFEIFKYGDVQGVNEHQISGVPSFFSPELYTMLKNQECTCKYSLEKNDIFSLGLVTLEMLFPEFQNFRKTKERQNQTFLSDYLKSKEDSIYKELQPILIKMLDFNQEMRINFKMLFEEMKSLRKLLEEQSETKISQCYEETKLTDNPQQQVAQRKQSEADKLKIQQENFYLKQMVESLSQEKEQLESVNAGLQQKFQQLMKKKKYSKKIRKDQVQQKPSTLPEEIKE